MFAMGMFLLLYVGGYNEIVWDYTDCCNNAEENVVDNRGRSPNHAILTSNVKTDSLCKCGHIVNETLLTEDNDQAKWDRDILIYYGLDNFYQNHRTYADSRDDKQLDGRRLNDNGDPD